MSRIDEAIGTGRIRVEAGDKRTKGECQKLWHLGEGYRNILELVTKLPITCVFSEYTKKQCPVHSKVA